MTHKDEAGKVLLYIAIAVAAVIGLLIASAWATRTPLYTLQAADHPDCVTPAPDRDVLIGLAVSGGGSRAALFAAGAMEALGKIRVGPEKRSLLEQVSYISSVSGGSMASGYYVSRKPAHAVPMLRPDGVMTQEYQEFFDRFKEDLTIDVEGLLIRRQLSRLRWINPAWMAWSLSEVLDEKYLDGMRFEDLARREAQGDSPRFLVNADDAKAVIDRMEQTVRERWYEIARGEGVSEQDCETIRGAFVYEGFRLALTAQVT